MKNYILQRKISRVIALLAERLNVTQPQALLLFYNSRVCQMLHNPSTCMHLMSDRYIVDEYMLAAQANA